MAHPFKVKDTFDKEIGPVMFRLSADYIKTAKEQGIQFDQEEAEHHFAVYLFKYDNETKQYQPDFDTLYLSFYEFPKQGLNNSFLSIVIFSKLFSLFF